MCGGVEARDAERSYKVYFPSPKAAIPVMLEGGESVGWVKWGAKSLAKARRAVGRGWKRWSGAAGRSTNQ